MIEMKVAGLALDATNRSPIVLLQDSSGRRQVPIWIDHAQAHNILSGIQGKRPEHPLTHDLMLDLLKAGGLDLERVIIHGIEKNRFQAVLKLRANCKPSTQEHASSTSTIEIDARPSDAIALSVRSNCSLWMLERVVADASIPVDADADQQDQDEFRQFINEISPADIVNHLEAKKPSIDQTSESSDHDPDDKK